MIDIIIMTTILLGTIILITMEGERRNAVNNKGDHKDE